MLPNIMNNIKTLYQQSEDLLSDNEYLIKSIENGIIKVEMILELISQIIDLQRSMYLYDVKTELANLKDTLNIIAITIFFKNLEDNSIDNRSSLIINIIELERIKQTLYKYKSDINLEILKLDNYLDDIIENNEEEEIVPYLISITTRIEYIVF